MKNILTILMIIVSFTMSSQDKDDYLSLEAGFDVLKPTKDYIFEMSWVYQNAEVNLGYEIYPEIDFQKYTVGLGYHFPLYAYIGKEIKTTFIPTIEPTLITRAGTWGDGLGRDNETNEIVMSNKSHFAIGLNLSLNWRLLDDIGLEYTFNMLPRTDLKALYGDIRKNSMSINGTPIVCSSYIKLVYYIDSRKL